MDGVKCCERCGVVIAYEETADWYAYIRIKYCDPCRKKVNNDQTAERMRQLRKRKRQEQAAQKTQLELLKEENELLRRRVQQLRNEVG